MLKLFIFWRLSLFFLTYLGALAFPLIANNGPGSAGPTKSFDYLASWAQWDGGYYLSIAEHGYKSIENYAFFPIYPFLVSALGKIVSSYLLAGLLISNILFLVFIFVFYSFVKRFFSEKTAKIAVITFLFFPAAFFGTAMYSESLFLLLSILTFYFLYKKNYFLSALFGSLSAITRVIGVFLGLSILYSVIVRRSKKRIKNLIWASFPFLAFFGYMLFLKLKTGDPFIFLNVQDLWQRNFIDPVSSLVASLFTLIFNQKPVMDYIDFSLTILFLTILILGRKKIPSSLWIFSMLTVLFPVSTGTLSSMPRYLLSSLGTFIIIADFLKSKPKIMYAVWTLSLILQIFLAVRFINGYWAS